MTSPTQIKPVRQMILAGFAIALLAVAGMGIFAFWRFSILSEKITALTQPNAYLQEVEALLGDLNKSEVGLRNYALRRQTKDIKLVEAFDRMKERRLNNMWQWAEQVIETDSSLFLQTQEIERLAQQKMSVMEQLIHLNRELDQRIFWEELRSRLDSLEPPAEKKLKDSSPLSSEEVVYLQQLSGRMDIDSTTLSDLLLLPAAEWLNLLEGDFFLQPLYDDNLQDLIEKDAAIRKELEGKLDTLRTQLSGGSLADNLAGGVEAERNSSSIWLFSTLILVVCLLLLWNIFRSLDRNRQLQEQLAEEKARAEKLATAKEEFLANMSHEIRTPMHALIGFSEQLATTRLNQRQKSLLEPIRHSANYLLALINDVLDYSKLGSGAFQLEKTSFGPQEILQEVVQALQPSAKTRGIRLVLKSKNLLPEVLEGDPLRLRQMLFNLIGNAIKFTEVGSVKIKPSFVQQEGTSKGELYLLIQDTGIGIPPDRIETIFSDFVQGDSSTTRKYGGTGLGLPITHKLAEMHGGSIKVESEVGVGTKVHLRLPYEISEQVPENGQEPKPVSSTEHLHGMRILLADDEPYNRALVAGMLEKIGIELDMVENGKQVLEKLEAGNTYDLMFLDLQMPEMDGMETARYIRRELKLDTPILALTATSTQSGIAEARAAGMNAHLLKPFQESEMISLLNRWQNQASSSESEAIAQEVPFEAATEESNPPETIPMSSSEKAYDLELLYKMSHQDPAMVAKMLTIFVDRANSLRQELQQALAAEDYEAIGKKAHQLIPSCRHLQLNQLVAQLKTIETQANAKELSANQKPEIEAVIADIEAVGKDIEAELVALGK